MSLRQVHAGGVCICFEVFQWFLGLVEGFKVQSTAHLGDNGAPGLVGVDELLGELGVDHEVLARAGFSRGTSMAAPHR